MNALKVLIAMALAITTICCLLDQALAETRTLTTTLLITVKAAEPTQAAAPTGVQDVYNTALVQNQAARIIKVEDPVYTPTGMARYTMSEKL